MYWFNNCNYFQMSTEELTKSNQKNDNTKSVSQNKVWYDV